MKTTYKIQQLLISQKFLEMENLIIKHFVKSFFKRVELEMPHVDWLLHKYRTIFPKQPESGVLHSMYMAEKASTTLSEDMAEGLRKNEERSWIDIDKYWKFSNEEVLYIIIQLCAFIRTPGLTKVQPVSFEDIVVECPEQVSLIVVNFPLVRFFDFIKIEDVNYYQRKKISTLFQSLPYSTAYWKEFDDANYLSSVSVGGFSSTVFYRHEKKLCVQFIMSKQLLRYSYPFRHSRYFLSVQDKQDLVVKIMMVRHFNRPGLIKSLPIQDFLSQYKSSDGKTRKSIQNYILQALKEFSSQGYIDHYLSIQTRHKGTRILPVVNLTRKDLPKAQQILVREKL